MLLKTGVEKATELEKPGVFQMCFPQGVEKNLLQKGDILWGKAENPGFWGIYTPRTVVFHSFPQH